MDSSSSDQDELDSSQIDFDNLSLSFNGCGFLGIYHVGVAAALRHHLPNTKLTSICGASAGAMAAVCLLGEVPLDKMTSDLLSASMDVEKYFLGPFNPNFDVCERLETSLMNLLPEDIHIRAQGKLHISVTSVYTGDNIVINNFLNKAELVQAVVASTFIPLFSGLSPTRWRGIRVIDGGFSVNQLKVGPETLTVSPFSGDAHICPHDIRSSPKEFTRVHIAAAGTNITSENLKRLMSVLYPPPAKDMADLLMQGYHDATSYLTRHGKTLNSCPTCLTVKSKYTPSEVLNHAKTVEPEHNAPSVFSGTLIECLQVLMNPKQMDREESLYHYAKLAVRKTIEWSPPFILARTSFQVTVSVLKKIIDLLTEWGPLMNLKTEVQAFIEKAVAITVGYFGPIIGYEYERVIPTHCHCDTEERLKEHMNKARFSCRFHITQTNAVEVGATDLAADSSEDHLGGYLDDEDVASGYGSVADSIDSCVIMSLQLESEMHDKDIKMPETHDEAMKLQAENLEHAAHSRVASRVTSRLHSLAPSLLASALNSKRASQVASARGSASQSRRGSISLPPNILAPSLSDGSSPETLENLLNVTRNQDTVLQTYYTDENGQVITLSLYDISDTDPADILGNDVLQHHHDLELQQEQNADDHFMDSADDPSYDFDMAVVRRLERLRRRYAQRSGNSTASEDSVTAATAD